MALYDIIMHQNKDDTGTAYSEVYPNLASGDPDNYNVVVAGEDGLPVLPQGVLREVNSGTLILEIGQYDEIHINDTGGGYIHFLSPNVVIQNTGANIIELSTAGAFTKGNEISMLSDYIGLHKTDGTGIIINNGIFLETLSPEQSIQLATHYGNYILLNSENGDVRIDHLKFLDTPNEKTLYIDSTDFNIVKYRGPEGSIADFVHAPWGGGGGFDAADMDLRATVEQLIDFVNGILAALRAHKVIME